MANYEVGTAGNAEFDVNDRRNRAGQILGALVDPDPAGDQPVIKLFEVGDAAADLLLRPVRALDVMKGDFQRHLHHR
jgi:hypothetical protein